MSETIATRLSTKGQVILPKRIRDLRNWTAGMDLLVEDTPAGVLITPAPKTVSMDEIFGCLKYDGPRRTIAEMDQAVLDEAARQFTGAGSDEGH